MMKYTNFKPFGEKAESIKLHRLMFNTILLKNANCDAMAWQPMEFSKYDGNRELEKYRNSLIYTITIHK